jgi:transcriptional regulator GlxA family with amidase domain
MKNLDFDIVSETRGQIPGRNSRSGQAISDNLQRIDRAVEYMVQNVDKPLRVAELAGVANVSLSHFFSLFRRRTGCSPIDYFMRLRIRRACRLLESTTIKIKDIATAVGYDDPFYFSRVFKSLSAVAPVYYRNLERELKLEINEKLESKIKYCPTPALELFR